MSILINFFTWLMEWCHSWCPNWWLDIAIFTLITKVIQFPISLWCQANSLKMVSLMPETNRIKMNHYGDNDAIGDETAALFRREKYHPLLSLVPLGIQILILMCFVKVIYGIGDKLTVPGLAKPLIACVPNIDGGIAWCMPVLAGLAAWLLGYTQNKMNPLQREQSRTQQIVTNGISICISLFLGCFVAMGVGMYWAVSNLSSILVQLFENICIPPKKHIDYPVLRRSQAELAKFESDLKSRAIISSEDKKREKIDYKRFFNVVNKHVVFYAEGGGYFKYFQSVIQWLLQNTNMTIHYVTNDPKDKVLSGYLGERVRGYFIGNTRIIPLFMKMDASMVVMTTPDLGTYHLKRSYVKKDVEYIYIDHGPTSIHMCYRKNAFDSFDTVMANGPAQVAEYEKMEQLYNLKKKRIVKSGYPYLDLLRPSSVANAEHKNSRIMLAPSHQEDNIFESCLDTIVSLLFSRSPQPTIVLRPHPQYVRRSPAKMEQIVAKYSKTANIILETDFSKPSTMDESDILITDWSGIAYEFAYRTRRPTIFIDTKMKIINPEWEKVGLIPTDISFRNEVGVAIQPIHLGAQLNEVVTDMLNNPQKFSTKIDTLFSTQFFNLQSAGEAVGRYILATLLEKKKSKA